MKTPLFVLGLVLSVLVQAGVAHAQDSEDRLQDLIRDLNALIEEGAEQKLADPWFLDDLRALSARYGETWPVVILDHRFDSQGSHPGAPWVVQQGDMKMDWSRGLRSRVELPRSGERERKSDEEVIGEIIGGLLGAKPSEGHRDPTEPALATAQLRVSNAFHIQSTISSRSLERAEEGAMELGVYQGGDAGYRILLRPDEDGGGTVSLIAISSRGTIRTLASTHFDRTILNDEPFAIRWSRYPDGAMSVMLEEEELLSARDTSFRDPFHGVLIGNRGGDYAVRQISVKGTE